jgi:hypothetical protein
MTLEEMRAAGKVARCHLPSGAELRYDPADGSVRTLPYPGMPRQWREASAYVHPLPREGWTHYRGCDCAVCSAVSESERVVERVSA